MQIRRFVGADMRQALAEVKKEFGPDAVIVATRKIKAPGIFGRPQVEVTAAIDSPEASGLFAKQGQDNPDKGLMAYKRVEGSAALASEAIKADEKAEPTDLSSSPPWLKILEDADVATDVAMDLVEQADRLWRKQGGVTSYDSTRQILCRVVVEALKERSAPKMERVLALVGPTGVGKTTTIAKLAARAALIDRKRVGLLTFDTYRIGAIEQLRQYAELLHVPLHVVHNRQEMLAALHELRDCEQIFIDTAGRSHADKQADDILRTAFADGDVQTYLVLSAATRRFELRALLKRYFSLKVSGLIFTKLDESAALGVIPSATQLGRLPVAFVTTGQRVPEDLAVPHFTTLTQRLVDRALALQEPRSMSEREGEEGAFSDGFLAGVTSWS